MEQVVLQLHRTSEEEESNTTHNDLFVDPELIIREEEWLNHKMDEGTFDPKLGAAAKQKALRKFDKLKVYEVVKEEEFKCDPKATKIGTKWVVTNEGTKTKPIIKARLVERRLPMTPRRRSCWQERQARASCAAVLGVQV